MQGRKKLKVEWDLNPEHAEFQSASLQAGAARQRSQARQSSAQSRRFRRRVRRRRAEARGRLLRADAGARVHGAAGGGGRIQDGKVEAWCPTQNPQAVQDAVAAALGIAPKDVICNVTLLGGGFGRKSKPDYVVEAALLSKAAGKPVKVVWTREDDISFDYYHSVAAMHMKGGLDAVGQAAIVALPQRLPADRVDLRRRRRVWRRFRSRHGR